MSCRKTSSHTFLFAKGYRTMASGWQGAPHFRRYARGLVSKPAISLKKSWGRATVERLPPYPVVENGGTPPPQYGKRGYPCYPVVENGGTPPLPSSEERTISRAKMGLPSLSSTENGDTYQVSPPPYPIVKKWTCYSSCRTPGPACSPSVRDA